MNTSLPVGWPRASERLMLLALLGARMVLLPSAGVRLCECAETPAVEGGRGLMVTSHLISPSVSVQATATSYAVPSRLPSVSDCDWPSSTEGNWPGRVGLVAGLGAG